MKNWWDVLGIDQAIDLRSIKRAYAVKLKTLKDSDDPYAFMELREAYETAVDFVNAKVENISLSKIKHTTKLQTKQEAAHFNEEDNNPSGLVLTDFHLPVSTVMDDVLALMKNPLGGSDAAGWSAIFSDDRLVVIDDFIAFEQDMFHWLMDTHNNQSQDVTDVKAVLSREVASLVFEMFDWKEKMKHWDANESELRWLARILKPINMRDVDWLSAYEIYKREMAEAVAANEAARGRWKNFKKNEELLGFLGFFGLVFVLGIIVAIKKSMECGSFC